MQTTKTWHWHYISFLSYPALSMLESSIKKSHISRLQVRIIQNSHRYWHTTKKIYSLKNVRKKRKTLNNILLNIEQMNLKHICAWFQLPAHLYSDSLKNEKSWLRFTRRNIRFKFFRKMPFWKHISIAESDQTNFILRQLCSLAQCFTNKWFKAATFWSEGYKCTQIMVSFADGEERLNYAKERVKKQGANAINYPITACLSLPTCLCADTMLLSL